MKKITTLFILCASMFIVSQSFAQSKNDFKGTWVGTGGDDNTVYELKLNADATCSFKINGVESYSITNYRIESFPPSAIDDNVQSPVRNILFQTNIHNNADNNAGAFSATGASQFLIYKGELKFTDENFSQLQVTIKMDENSGDQLQCNLTR
jgi:hypothetical protein